MFKFYTGCYSNAKHITKYNWVLTKIKPCEMSKSQLDERKLVREKRRPRQDNGQT